MVELKTRIVCLIPARGGSKRLPRKNALLLGGVPLIVHTIRAALDSNVFTKVVLSTDDEEIARIGQGEGIEIDHRPAVMAADHVSTVEVLYEYLERTRAWGEFDVVAKMLPTCPFRTANDVENASKLFLDHNTAESLVSVTAYDFPVNLGLRRTSETLVEMIKPEAYVRLQSQDQEQIFHPNGAVYLSKSDSFRSRKTFFHERMAAYEMPAIRSIDIDYPYQLQMARIMLEQMPEIFNSNTP